MTPGNPGFDEQGEIASSLPDNVHFGTVRLYRAWNITGTYELVDRDGRVWKYGENPGSRWLTERRTGIALCGISVHGKWRNGWNDARCSISYDMVEDRYYDGPPSDHRAPVVGCGCGFWAYWLPDEVAILSGAGSMFSRFAGVIEVAGRVRMGLLGVRAEKARIVALHGPRLDEVKQSYPDVAFYDDTEALLADYPPTDTTPMLGMTAQAARDRHYSGSGEQINVSGQTFVLSSSSFTWRPAPPTYTWTAPSYTKIVIDDDPDNTDET